MRISDWSSDVCSSDLLLFLDTQPGKKFLIRQIAALKLESGMAIEVGRIDGSIYSDMTIRNLVLRDPKGIFAVSPEVHVVWSPRSEELRVGKEFVSTCRSRWSPSH